MQKVRLVLLAFLYRFYYNEQRFSGAAFKSADRRKMADINNTQFFDFITESEIPVKKVLESVYDAMREKGYNPVSQIVGYIMSGDPTYITSYNGARSMIMKVERDELVEELLREYIKNESWKES